MEDLIGKIIENYKIISVIGQGGMGIVYKAYDTKLERHVAIKMLSAKTFNNPNLIERFKREAKNQAKLSHPNIVTVYGFIEYSGLLGIVMELIEGESLEKVIIRQGRIHLYDALYILKQILLGMGYAHARGFIHRDIKPSNIIFNDEGIAKIMDFGISKSLFDKSFTKTGAKVGTVYYMSPEQIRGEELTHHSDIYSIGCTFYEMLTGEPPFRFESEFEIMEGHLKNDPPKISQVLPGMPDILNKLVLKSLKKDPDERYTSCEDFANDIHDIDSFLANAQDKYFRKKKRDPKKVKLYSILGFSAFFILLIGLAYFVYNQVYTLMQSDYLDNLKKYSIESIFSDDDEFELTQVEHQNSGVSVNLNSVEFLDDNYGLAFGDSGTMLRTFDGGVLWEKLDSMTNRAIYDAALFKNGKSFIIGDSSLFMTGEDYLTTFSTFNISKDYSLFNVDFIDDYNGFILGTKGIVLRTTDGGSNWRRTILTPNEILYDLSFINNEEGYIVGFKGVVFKTTNSGESWAPIPQFTNKYLKSIDFWDEDLGIAVGGGTSIFMTTDGGNDWNQVKLENVGGLQKVKFLSEDYVIIIGSKGLVMISDDGGNNWRGLNVNTFFQLSDLAVTPSGVIYIVGGNGTIIKLM